MASFIRRAICGLLALEAFRIGSAVAHPAVPHYFRSYSSSPQNVSIPAIEKDLGQTLSNSSTIFGPSDPRWDNSTGRFQEISPPEIERCGLTCIPASAAVRRYVSAREPIHTCPKCPWRADLHEDERRAGQGVAFIRILQNLVPGRFWRIRRKDQRAALTPNIKGNKKARRGRRRAKDRLYNSIVILCWSDTDRIKLTMPSSEELIRQARYETTTLGMLYRQWATPKPLPLNANLVDQVAIITGSNGGLGLEAGRHLLRLGLSHLVMAVRSQRSGEAAADGLRREFPRSDVSVWLLDLESYDSVVAFAERCQSLPRLDIAILNAALSKKKFDTVAATGHETGMQVNYYSTALLAVLLAPIMKSKRVSGNARPPVLTIVGSDRHYQTTLRSRGGQVLPQLDQADKYDQMEWYSRSKMLIALFGHALARQVSSDDVLINIANPGFTKGTNLAREFSPLVAAVLKLMHAILGRETDVAATIYVDAAIARGPETHGEFLSEWVIKPFPELHYTPEGEELERALWEETLQELKFVGASKIISDLRNKV